jgi:quinol monooxygenase YgiN
MLTESRKTVRVVARFKARAGCGPQLQAILEGLVAPTCKEEGCMLYQLHGNPNDPNDLVFIEEWESEATLDAHSNSAHVSEARAKFPGLVEVGPDVRTYLLIR